MKLSTCIHQFISQYLIHIKGVSENTIKAYRDTFTLFLPFAAQHLSIKVYSLRVDHLTPKLILAFLKYIETKRNNTARTRNHRLAVFKSLAKMLLLMVSEHKEIAEKIINIPEKRTQRPLVGFLYQEEILKIVETVNIKKKEGLRDFTLLHLLYDSGARASEIAGLKLDYFNPENKTLAILGKGNHYRQILIWDKTVQLLKLYIASYRRKPKPFHQNRLFITQRGEGFTRHGIHRVCKKYLLKALPKKRFKELDPVHCFRHSRAVQMLSSGAPISDIKNHLGHQNIQSTMVYLHLNLSQKKQVQKKFIQYTKSLLMDDPKIEELLDWENKEEILSWLDSL